MFKIFIKHENALCSKYLGPGGVEQNFQLELVAVVQRNIRGESLG